MSNHPVHSLASIPLLFGLYPYRGWALGDQDILPVEVKAGKTGTLRSLFGRTVAPSHRRMAACDGRRSPVRSGL